MGHFYVSSKPKLEVAIARLFLSFAIFFVTLQCDSHRVALQMLHFPIVTTISTAVLRQWGHLENWKSTASTESLR